MLAEHGGVEGFLEVVEILVVEHPAEDGLHPLPTALVALQFLHQPLVHSKVVPLQTIRSVEGLGHPPVLFVLQIVLIFGEEIAFLFFLIFVAILVAEDLIQSQNIFGAGHKGYVGVSELMMFLEIIGEEI